MSERKSEVMTPRIQYIICIFKNLYQTVQKDINRYSCILIESVALVCAEEVTLVSFIIIMCTEESTKMLSTVSKPHKISCECSECEDKLLIDHSFEILKYYDSQTSPETLASHDNLLKNAFDLTKKIEHETEQRGMELRKQLQVYIKRCKSFTVGLCDECDTKKEIAALMNFDEETLNELSPASKAKMVKMLEKAVEADHVEVFEVGVCMITGRGGGSECGLGVEMKRACTSLQSSLLYRVKFNSKTFD